MCAMRRAVSGLSNTLRVASVPSHRHAQGVTLWCGDTSCRGMSALLSSVQIDHVITRDTDSIQGRRLSSKPSSPESLKPSASEKVSVQSSTKPDTSLSLISSEGSTKSLLTGPRIKSKKGYLERENMIRETQKAIRQYYKEGMYQDALEVTHRLVDQVDDHFGRAHGVYASALSDMALMMKSIGQHKDATDTYLKALEVYRAVYKGEENASFASTLHNLGMAFRAMAEESSKLERIPLLERAGEAFERSVQIREKILTNNHPDLQLARSRLAVVQRLLGGEAERTEAKLRASLDGLQMAVGDEDASTANAMTNLALFLKGEGKYEEATRLCTTALATRTEIYGPKHFDVLVAMHNLSMVHHAAGREGNAVKLQEEIARIGEEMGITEENQQGADEVSSSSSTEGTSEEPVRLYKTRAEAKEAAAKQGEDADGSSAATWKPGRK